MILIDSSAWIQVLNQRDIFAYRAAVFGEEVVTCLPVMQEVLQGIADERAFHFAKAAFTDIPILENPLTREVYEEAVQLYRVADARDSLSGRASTASLRHVPSGGMQPYFTSTATSRTLQELAR